MPKDKKIVEIECGTHSVTPLDGDVGKAVRLGFHGGSDFFEDHYEEWRQKRLAKLIQIVGGSEWLKGKTVLELGSAWGDLGATLAAMGSTVTVAEGRETHVWKAQKKYPHLESHVLNQETNWENFFDDRKFDLIIHWGTLYHLKNWEQDLKITLQYGHKICLETEVMDSDDPYLVGVRRERGNDQAVGGIGSYPSWATIERILAENNCTFVRYDDEDINTGCFTYDWKESNSGSWAGNGCGGHGGQRRFWMIESPH